MSREEAIYHASPPWVQTLLLNAHALRIHRHRFGRRLDREVAELAEQEDWDRGRMRAWQDTRLREVVAVAFARSRYYRDAMTERRLSPADIRGVADLPKLPILTKEIVRDRPGDLLTARPPQRGWLHGHTSGTTGSPLDLWYDRRTAVLTNAVDVRQKRWAGLTARDWIGLFLGRVVVSPAQAKPPFWRANHVHRQIWFSSFHLRPEFLDRYVEEIERRGLRFLEGYPSTLFIIAQQLNRQGRTLPMAAVFSSSETLHAVQRDAIERAFAAPLFDFYGLAERVIFATECERHDGKHIAEGYGYVEVVDPAGNPVPDGAPGFLVGTSLHNTALPMLRYRTSDVTRIRTEPCGCGRTSRLLDNVTTKAEDIVVTPDGRMISPSILTHPFKPFHQLLKSQVIQEAADRIRVLVVPSEEFTADHEALLTAGLRERLGDGVSVTVERVADIPAERSGKFRWVISRVAHDNTLDWS